MSVSLPSEKGPCELETVIVTAELARRTARGANTALETRVLLKLQRELAEDPQAFFSKLVEAALVLSAAESAGISLLDEAENSFVWPAVAGALSRLAGGGTPRDFGPCGTVVDRDTTLLMARPERHFAYLSPISPPLEEVLLIPFYYQNQAVGTLWAVSHTVGRGFDQEDRRLLESLSSFAGTAYQMLARLGLLAPLLRPKAR